MFSNTKRSTQGTKYLISLLLTSNNKVGTYKYYEIIILVRLCKRTIE